MTAPSQLHSAPCQDETARRRADDINCCIATDDGPALLYSVPCQSGTGCHTADDINRTAAGDGRRPDAVSSSFKK